MTRAALIAAIILPGLAGAGGCDINFFLCEPADRAALDTLPVQLSDTSLYEDIATDTVAADALLYEPAYELWSDGASKRRWLQLPPDTTIDTRQMDDWQFPVGTRVWKEFAVDGVAVETRLLERIGPDVRDWAAVSYAWRDDGSDADMVIEGFIGARGTAHNVPAASECAGCHAGRASFILGVSAIQLSHQPSGAAALGELVDLGLLSDPPAEAPVIPGTATERDALGYLHANCGHCHNRSRPERDRARCFDPKNILDFWLVVDGLGSPELTPTYQTAIGFKITPGDPDDSRVVDRMARRDFIYQMPPLGTEEVDEEAVELVRRWVREL